MKIRLNGKTHRVAPDWTVSDLVVALGFGARNVVVERNGEPLARSRFGAVRLAEGDVIEVVRPVPGG